VFLDYIILPAIALLLVWRLYTVLGKRTGNERPRPGPAGMRRTGDAAEGNVVQLPGRPADADRPALEPARDAPPRVALNVDPAAQPGLDRIAAAEPGFDPASFLGGARAAFEMIVNAYAAGDSATLRPLLSDDVFAQFDSAIRHRAEARETHQTTLVGIDEATIAEAELQGRTALVTVRFVSQQINVTRDAEGRVLDGDPSTVTRVTDIWTFSRDTRARDPNWTLVATRSPS
jgi:predicted lipid-binding transport protein (Tim44 family)